MLEHEDHGMMATFEVVSEGAGQKRSQGLEQIVQRDVEPSERDVVTNVISAARDGSPAPASLLGTSGKTPQRSRYLCEFDPGHHARRGR
jgi:hypothetical protein